MKIIRLWFLLFVAVAAYGQVPYSTNIFNQIVFYDGYAETVSEPVPDGVVRLSNARYAKKLSASEIESFNSTLSLEVKLNPLCDNYDRQGGVFFAFVPSEQNITSEDKKVIEIGRFITPFMDMNEMPNEVTYNYDLNHLIGIFKNTDFLETYDIWVEMYLFSVPYAAHNEIVGCSGRDDVYQGTVTFYSEQDDDVNTEYLPKALWSRLRMNKTTDTDLPGTAVRIVNFSTEENLVDAKIHLITSAHGAGAGGEEYVRRNHHVYFNDEEILVYKPGGESCEPYRQFNTQPNCIYLICGSPGNPPRTNWTNSNWCPGAAIPNRIIEIGDVNAGQHSFKVSVPTGQFPNDNDEIIISAFIYSKDNATLGNKNFQVIDYNVYPNPTMDEIRITSSETVSEIALYDINGKKVSEVANSNQVSMIHLPAGTYIAKIKFSNGINVSENIVKVNH